MVEPVKEQQFYFSPSSLIFPLFLHHKLLFFCVKIIEILSCEPAATRFILWFSLFSLVAKKSESCH